MAERALPERAPPAAALSGGAMAPAGPGLRLVLLLAVFLLAAAGFMLLAPRGAWSFLIPFRAERLAALTLIGATIGVATVLFQTVAGNRILTPSVMGFDALYGLFQTGLVFLLGGIGYVTLDPRLKFLAETGVMIAVALALLGLLLGRGRHDLHRMLLVGLIFGVFFRSLSGLMQRMMDPNAFAVVQGASFASFNRVNSDLLAITAGVSLLALAGAWRMRHALDVVALGRPVAIGLGVDHDRTCRRALALVAVLVSAATALVGPVAFFGLLVACLAHAALRAPYHAALLPAAALIGATVLVAGQTLFERYLGLQATLSVVIEFIGGLLFLTLLLRRRA